jgi:hypothetical protein
LDRDSIAFWDIMGERRVMPGMKVTLRRPLEIPKPLARSPQLL